MSMLDQATARRVVGLLVPQQQAQFRRCGGCLFWMTKRCPREVHDNTAGHSRGPSSLEGACVQWAPGVAA